MTSQWNWTFKKPQALIKHGFIIKSFYEEEKQEYINDLKKLKIRWPQPLKREHGIMKVCGKDTFNATHFEVTITFRNYQSWPHCTEIYP